jgi:hypothetical protein
MSCCCLVTCSRYLVLFCGWFTCVVLHHRPDRFCGPPSLIPNGEAALSTCVKCLGVKLTTPKRCRSQEDMDLFIHSHIRLHFVFFNQFIIIIYFKWKWVLPGVSDTTIRHNTQIHMSKKGHITLKNSRHTNYTNNKGHTAHSKYNVNTINITVNIITINHNYYKD